jgi:3-hydroxyacyl-CoA dehydrogenase
MSFDLKCYPSHIRCFGGNCMKIETVTVLGANGSMGCNISAIFASFGHAKVYMVSRSLEKSKKAALQAAKSVKADSILRNLIPVDYSMLEKCIQESDLVFESAAEDLRVKLELNKRIARSLREDTICCSGTSGLSITTLASVFPDQLRKNYMGLHMYNPPYSMMLCELIPTPYTDRDQFEKVKEYVSKTLHRTVVEVKDSPAFLGNRIGFQFINEALQYAEKSKDSGGIDYIDSIMGPFTGRSMAPLVTSDFVGLDVHKAIVDNLYQNTEDYARDTFIMPEFAIGLVNEGKLGRKTGGGFYKVEVGDNGSKRYLVYDINSRGYRERMQYSFPFVESMVASFKIGDYEVAFKALITNRSKEAELCLEFLLKYSIYALSAASFVGYDLHSADDVMAMGYNWCPPLATITALFGVENVKRLAKERLSKDLLDTVDLERLLAKDLRSKYDYRRYFKAKK